MSFRLRITLRNPTQKPRKVVIHGGTVFEVKDPFSGRQNLVATGSTTVMISPGGSPQPIEIDTWCLNQHFKPPHNTPMRPTVLATAQIYSSQEDVWASR